MRKCPDCNSKIGLAGLERTGRYADNKKWYQVARYQTCCPHCKVLLRAVNRRPFLGVFAVWVLVFSHITLIVSGNEYSLRSILVLAYATGVLLFVLHAFSFRIEIEDKS